MGSNEWCSFSLLDYNIHVHVCVHLSLVFHFQLYAVCKFWFASSCSNFKTLLQHMLTVYMTHRWTVLLLLASLCTWCLVARGIYSSRKLPFCDLVHVHLCCNWCVVVLKNHFIYMCIYNTSLYCRWNHPCPTLVGNNFIPLCMLVYIHILHASCSHLF